MKRLLLITILLIPSISNADTKIFGVTEIQSQNLTVSSKTANFTAGNDKSTYLCDATSGEIIATLPPAGDTDVTNRVYTFVKTDSTANKVILEADGTQTINGELNLEINTQYISITISSDGSNWTIL